MYRERDTYVYTCHILPPSEVDVWDVFACFLVFAAGLESMHWFTPAGRTP